MVKNFKRTNTIFEMAQKRSLIVSKKTFCIRDKMMEKIGRPESVVDRALYEPHNIRSTDLAD